MSLGLQKIILAGAGSNTPGAYFQTTTVAVGATTTALVPAGLYVLIPSTNINVQATTDNGSTWTTFIAANTGGTLFSDGVNIRFNNSSTAANVTLLTVNGGQAVSGTYNQ